MSAIQEDVVRYKGFKPEEDSVYIERLLRLRKLMKTIPQHLYDHYMFISDDNECGTVACTLGHAVVNRKTLFPGLPLEAFIDSDGYIEDISCMEDWDDESEAADAYFGFHAYENIMSCFAYDIERVTTKDVVNRIDNHLLSHYNYTVGGGETDYD